MYYLHNQPWSSPESPELDGEFQWNLWGTRLWPYNRIEVGDRLLLCCPVPGGSRITWEAELTQVEKAPYGSKCEAWQTIAASFPQLKRDLGWTYRTFRDAEYTKARPEVGHLLAFTYDPVQELQVDRPRRWRLRPNGWLVLTDEEAQSLTGPPSRRRGSSRK